MREKANEIYFLLPFTMKQTRVSICYLLFLVFYEQRSSFGEWNAIERLIVRARFPFVIHLEPEAIKWTEKIDSI